MYYLGHIIQQKDWVVPFSDRLAPHFPFPQLSRSVCLSQDCGDCIAAPPSGGFPPFAAMR
jgi:hypothetical protein